MTMKKTQSDLGPLRVIETPDALTLEIDWQDQQSAQDKKEGVAASSGLIIVGVLLWTLAEIYIIAGTLLFFGLMYAYATTATIFNKTRIHITPERIRARTLPVPFASLLGAANFSQPTVNVRQIVTERYLISTEEVEHTYLVKLLNKDGTERKLFNFQGKPELASRIEQRIEDYLGIEDDPNAKSRHYDKVQNFLNQVTGIDDDDH